MPTYGYRCQKCGHEFDVRQRMTDESKADCPACGGGGKRLFFPAGILFKGTGFYKTDSRKAGESAASSSPATTPSPSSAPSTPSKSTDTPSSSSPTAAASAD